MLRISNELREPVAVEVDTSTGQVRISEQNTRDDGSRSTAIIRNTHAISATKGTFTKYLAQLSMLQEASGLNNANLATGESLTVPLDVLISNYHALSGADDEQAAENVFGRNSLTRSNAPSILYNLEDVFKLPEELAVTNNDGLDLPLSPIIEVSKGESGRVTTVSLGKYALELTERPNPNNEADGTQDAFAEVDKVNNEARLRARRISRGEKNIGMSYLTKIGVPEIQADLLDWDDCYGWKVTAGRNDYIIAFPDPARRNDIVARGIALGLMVLQRAVKNGESTVSSNTLFDLVTYAMVMLDDENAFLKNKAAAAEETIAMLETMQFADSQRFESIINKKDGTYYISNTLAEIEVEKITDVSHNIYKNASPDDIVTLDPGQVFIPPEVVADDLNSAAELSATDLTLVGSLLSMEGYPQLNSETSNAAAVLGLSVSSSAARRKQVLELMGVEISFAQAYDLARDILNYSQIEAAVSARVIGGGRTLAKTGRRGIRYTASSEDLMKNSTGALFTLARYKHQQDAAGDQSTN